MATNNIEQLSKDILLLASRPSSSSPVLEFVASAGKVFETFGFARLSSEEDSSENWRTELGYAVFLCAFHEPTRTWQRAQIDAISKDQVRLVFVGFPKEDGRWFDKSSKLLRKSLPLEYEAESWRALLMEGSSCDVFWDKQWIQGTVLKVLEEEGLFVVNVEGNPHEFPFASPFLAEFQSRTGPKARFSLLPRSHVSNAHLVLSVPPEFEEISKLFIVNGGVENSIKALQEEPAEGRLGFLLAQALGNGLLVAAEGGGNPEVCKRMVDEILRKLSPARLRVAIISLEIFMRRSGAFTQQEIANRIELSSLNAAVAQARDPRVTNTERQAALNMLVNACSAVYGTAAHDVSHTAPSQFMVNEDLFTKMLMEKNIYDEFTKSEADYVLALPALSVMTPRVQNGMELVAKCLRTFNSDDLLKGFSEDQLKDMIVNHTSTIDLDLLVACLTVLRDLSFDNDSTAFWWDDDRVFNAVCTCAQRLCRTHDTLALLLECIYSPSNKTYGSAETVNDLAIGMVMQSMESGDYAQAAQWARFVDSGFDVGYKTYVLNKLESRKGDDQTKDLESILDILFNVSSQQPFDLQELQRLWRLRCNHSRQSLSRNESSVEVVSSDSSFSFSGAYVFDSFFARCIQREFLEHDPSTTENNQHRISAGSGLGIMASFYRQHVSKKDHYIALRIRGFELGLIHEGSIFMDASSCLGTLLDSLSAMMMMMQSADEMRDVVETDKNMKLVCEFIFRHQLHREALDWLESELVAVDSNVDEDQSTRRRDQKLIVLLETLSSLLDVSDARGTRGYRSHLSLCSDWNQVQVVVTFPESVSQLKDSKDDLCEPLMVKHPVARFNTKSGATIWDLKTLITKCDAILQTNLSPAGLMLVCRGNDNLNQISLFGNGPQNATTLGQFVSSNNKQEDLVLRFEAFRLLPPPETREALLRSRVPLHLSTKAERAFTEIFEQYADGRPILGAEQFCNLAFDCTGKHTEPDNVRKMFSKRNLESLQGMSLDEFCEFYASLAAKTPGKVWKDLEALGFDYVDFRRRKRSKNDRLTFELAEGLHDQVFGEEKDDNNDNDEDKLTTSFRSEFKYRDTLFEALFECLRPTFSHLEDDDDDNNDANEKEQMIQKLAWDILMRAPTCPRLVREMEEGGMALLRANTIAANSTGGPGLLLYLVQIGEFLLKQSGLELDEDSRQQIILGMCEVYTRCPPFQDEEDVDERSKEIRSRVETVLSWALKEIPREDAFWEDDIIKTTAQQALNDLLTCKDDDTLLRGILEPCLTSSRGFVLSREQIIRMVETVTPSSFKSVFSAIQSLSNEGQFSAITEALDRLVQNHNEDARYKENLLHLSGVFFETIRDLQSSNSTLALALAKFAVETLSSFPQASVRVLCSGGLTSLLKSSDQQPVLMKETLHSMLNIWLESNALNESEAKLVFQTLMGIDSFHTSTTQWMRESIFLCVKDLVEKRIISCEDDSKEDIDTEEKSNKILIGPNPEMVAMLLQLGRLSHSRCAKNDDDTANLTGKGSPALTCLELFQQTSRRRIELGETCPIRQVQIQEEDLQVAKSQACVYHVTVIDVCDSCGSCSIHSEKRTGPLKLVLMHSNLDELLRKYQEETKVPNVACGDCGGKGAIRRTVKFLDCESDCFLIEFIPTEQRKRVRIPLVRNEHSPVETSIAAIEGLFASSKWQVDGLWYRRTVGKFYSCVRGDNTWDRYECEVNNTNLDAVGDVDLLDSIITDQQVLIKGLTLTRVAQPNKVDSLNSSRVLSKAIEQDEKNLRVYHRLCSPYVSEFVSKVGDSQFQLYHFLLIRHQPQSKFDLALKTMDDDQKRRLAEHVEQRGLDWGLCLGEAECGNQLVELLRAINVPSVLRDLIVAKRYPLCERLLATRASSPSSNDPADFAHECVKQVLDDKAMLQTIALSNAPGGLMLFIQILQIEKGKMDLSFLLYDSSVFAKFLGRLQEHESDQNRICMLMGNSMVTALKRIFLSHPDQQLAEFALRVLRKNFDCRESIHFYRYLCENFDAGQKEDLRKMAHVLTAIFTIGSCSSKAEKHDLVRVCVTFPAVFEQLVSLLVESHSWDVIRSIISCFSDDEHDAKKQLARKTIGSHILRSFAECDQDWIARVQLVADIRPMSAGGDLETEMLWTTYALRRLHHLKTLSGIELMCDRMERSSRLVSLFAHLPVPEDEDRATDWALRFLQRFPEEQPEERYHFPIAMRCLRRWVSLEKRMDTLCGRKVVRFPHESADILVRVALACKLEETVSYDVVFQVLGSKKSILFWATNGTRNPCVVLMWFDVTGKEKFQLPTELGCTRRLMPGESGLVYEGIRNRDEDEDEESEEDDEEEGNATDEESLTDGKQKKQDWGRFSFHWQFAEEKHDSIEKRFSLTTSSFIPTTATGFLSASTNNTNNTLSPVLQVNPHLGGDIHNNFDDIIERDLSEIAGEGSSTSTIQREGHDQDEDISDALDVFEEGPRSDIMEESSSLTQQQLDGSSAHEDESSAESTVIGQALREELPAVEPVNEEEDLSAVEPVNEEEDLSCTMARLNLNDFDHEEVSFEHSLTQDADESNASDEQTVVQERDSAEDLSGIAPAPDDEDGLEENAETTMFHQHHVSILQDASFVLNANSKNQSYQPSRDASSILRELPSGIYRPAPSHHQQRNSHVSHATNNKAQNASNDENDPFKENSPSRLTISKVHHHMNASSEWLDGSADPFAI